MLAACAGGGAASGEGAIDRGPAPAYADVAARYNARVADLDRIWARSTTRIWYTDDSGEEQSDQADGHLAYTAPRSLLLTVDRFGETYAILGADDEQYWWISLAEDDRGAIVGRHEDTTPEAAQRAGLPVHPLDLLALLGVAPLPAEGAVSWSDDGRSLVVSTDARWGRMSLHVAPETMEPAEVTLLRDDRAAVGSTLTDYIQFSRRDQASDVRMPSEAFITAHGNGARIRMSLSDFRAWGRTPNPGMFNLNQHLLRNRISPGEIRRVEDAPLAGAQSP